MKPLLRITACFLITGSACILSCKREVSCETCLPAVKNKPPNANAGLDQKIALPKDSVLLDGTASTDPDGKIISYKWIKISGPASSSIINPDSSKTFVKNLLMGVYDFELTVTDYGGLSAKDTVQIIVNDPAHNQPPVANAGSDQTITLPVDSVLLNGNLSFDPDGTIVSYQWTKISGPSSFNIINANSV
ncbi:MAG: PKD domain-containing protein, partial [Bacteroidota bacterium]|nr:PKD domain-containing protein [Bacteroidota bacterium]